MAQSPQEWYQALPPLTRVWFTAAVGTAFAAKLGLISGYSLILNWPLILGKFQIWRLVTNLVFFGGPSFPWMMTMFMLVQFVPRYESDPFPSGPGAHAGNLADVAFALLFAAGVLLPLSYLLNVVVLSSSLFFMMIYLWSKRSPESPTRFYMFSVPAKYLPWVMLAFSFVVGEDIVADLLGMGAGHLYYFIKQELPHLDTPLKGLSSYLSTPSWLYRLTHENPTDVPPGQRMYVAHGGGGGGGAAGGAGAAAAAGARARVAGGGHNWGQGNRLGTQ